jgi:hypothetical protein
MRQEPRDNDDDARALSILSLVMAVLMAPERLPSVLAPVPETAEEERCQ